MKSTHFYHGQQVESQTLRQLQLQQERKKLLQDQQSAVYTKVALQTINANATAKSTQRQGGRKGATLQVNQVDSRKSQSLQRGGRRLQTLKAPGGALQPNHVASKHAYQNYMGTLQASYGALRAKASDALAQGPKVTTDGATVSIPAGSIRACPPRAKSNYRSQRTGNQKPPAPYLNPGNSMQRAAATIRDARPLAQHTNLMTATSRPENLGIRSSRGLYGSKQYASGAKGLQDEQGFHPDWQLAESLQWSSVPQSTEIAQHPKQITLNQEFDVYSHPAGVDSSSRILKNQGNEAHLSVRHLPLYARNARTEKESMDEVNTHSGSNQNLLDTNLTAHAQTISEEREPVLHSNQPAASNIQGYESSLNQAIVQDQRMLESIQQNWAEVNNRIQQRAQLLQTLQITNETAREKAKLIGLTTLEHPSQRPLVRPGPGQARPQAANTIGLTLNGSNDSCIELGSALESRQDTFERAREIQAMKKNARSLAEQHGQLQLPSEGHSKRQSPNVLVSYETTMAKRTRGEPSAYRDAIPQPGRGGEIQDRSQDGLVDQPTENSFDLRPENHPQGSIDVIESQEQQVSPFRRASLNDRKGNRRAVGQNQLKSIKQSSQAAQPEYGLKPAGKYSSVVQNSKQKPLGNALAAKQGSKIFENSILYNSGLNTENYSNNVVSASVITKRPSPDPRSKFQKDIRQIAQVYRQGRVGTNLRRNNKNSINSEPKSLSFERSEPRNQQTLSHSRERAVQHKESSSQERRQPAIAQVVQEEPYLKNHQTLQVKHLKSSNPSLISISYNNSSYNKNHSQKRRLQGSKKRGAAGPEELMTSTQRATSIMVNEERLKLAQKPQKLSNQVTIRKGVSKSTIRQNLRSLNNNIAKNSGTQQLLNSTVKGSGNQSLVRERISTISRRGAGPRIVQGSIVLQQQNRVQLKKSIQHATYQNQMTQRTLVLANQQMIKSQNVGEAINQTIASLGGILGAQQRTKDVASRYPNHVEDEIQVGYKVIPNGVPFGADQYASLTNVSLPSGSYQQSLRPLQAQKAVRKVKRLPVNEEGQSPTLNNQYALTQVYAKKQLQPGNKTLGSSGQHPSGSATRGQPHRKLKTYQNAYNSSAPHVPGENGEVAGSDSNSRSGSVPANRKYQHLQGRPQHLAANFQSSQKYNPLQDSAHQPTHLPPRKNGFKSTQPVRSTFANRQTQENPAVAHSDGLVQMDGYAHSAEGNDQGLMLDASHQIDQTPSRVQTSGNIYLIQEEDRQNLDGGYDSEADENPIMSNQFSFKKEDAANSSLKNKATEQREKDLQNLLGHLSEVEEQKVEVYANFEGKGQGRQAQVKQKPAEAASHRYRDESYHSDEHSQSDFHQNLQSEFGQYPPPEGHQGAEKAQQHQYETFEDNMLFQKADEAAPLTPALRVGQKNITVISQLMLDRQPKAAAGTKSINELFRDQGATQHQFIENLKQLERVERQPRNDETVNSSKFELNLKDKEHIQDFLSAKNSITIQGGQEQTLPTQQSILEMPSLPRRYPKASGALEERHFPMKQNPNMSENPLLNESMNQTLLKQEEMNNHQNLVIQRKLNSRSKLIGIQKDQIEERSVKKMVPKLVPFGEEEEEKVDERYRESPEVVRQSQDGEEADEEDMRPLFGASRPEPTSKNNQRYELQLESVMQTKGKATDLNGVSMISEKYNEELDPSRTSNQTPRIQGMQGTLSTKEQEIVPFVDKMEEPHVRLSQSSMQNMLESIDDMSQRMGDVRTSSYQVPLPVRKDNFLENEYSSSRKRLDASRGLDALINIVKNSPSNPSTTKKVEESGQDDDRYDKNPLAESQNSNILCDDSIDLYRPGTQDSNDHRELHSSRIFQKQGIVHNNTAFGHGDHTVISDVPLLDLGCISSGSLNSNKTPPMHSDDEVTPRRGLDDLMSARKLELLQIAIDN